MRGLLMLRFVPGVLGGGLLVAAALIAVGLWAALAVAGVLLLAVDRRMP